MEFLFSLQMKLVYPSNSETQMISGSFNSLSLALAPLASLYKKLIFLAQRLINLEIPVLLHSLKSSNVELVLDGRLFKCCLSAAANS